MTEESIRMQEMLESLQNIAKDVLKIEEKIYKLNDISNEKKIETVENPLEFNAHVSKKREIQTEKTEEIEQIKKPKLIISERTGYVYLPYTQSDIDYYKRCGYETEVEIARRFFTVPLKKYSNFSKSRVRERLCFNETT